MATQFEQAKSQTYSRKTNVFLKRAIPENLNIDLISVGEIISGLGYKKKVYLMGTTSSCTLNEESKTGSMSTIACC